MPVFCERLQAPDAVELFNTLSAFALALPAIVGWKLLRQHPSRDPIHTLLVCLAALLPFSQITVHAVRLSWTPVIDQLPLALFASLFFVDMFWRRLGLSLAAALLNVAGFALLVLFSRQILPFTPIADAATIAPPVLVFLLTGGVLIAQGRGEMQVIDSASLRGAPPVEKRRIGRLLIIAGLVLTAAMIARVQDVAMCKAVPIGLHWLWHLGSAVVTSLMLLAALGQSQR